MAAPPPYKDTQCPWNQTALPWKAKPASTDLSYADNLTPAAYSRGLPWNDPRLPWQDPANP